MEQVHKKLEEVYTTETQIDWFERKHVDLKKKNRYAKVTLDEYLNYEERFA